MTSGKIQVSQELLDALQYAMGTDLDCDEIMALGDTDSHINIVFGCVQSLNYASSNVQGHESPQLQKVVLRDIEGRTKAIRKTSPNNDDCVAINLDKFERILKNAADFGHEIFAIIKNKDLVSVTLGINKCNVVRTALSRTKRSPGSPD